MDMERCVSMVRAHPVAVAAAASVLLLPLVIRGARKYRRRSHLLAKIAARRAEREESIEWARREADKVDDTTRQRVGAMDFEQLQAALQKGELCCVDVLRTYLHKALLAHEKTNCITLFIKECVSWAEQLDSQAASPSFHKPAFFGMPVSIKECVPVRGYDATRGYAGDIGAPAESDSLMMQQLKHIGAVPFVQTNVPQSLLSYSCQNPIYGTTSNPFSSSRTPGGSSGGESAIIGAGGSLIGIGGDVGGSVRIPSHYTGIVAIKPCALRFSHRGITGSIPGRPLINANDGPMAQSVQSIVQLLRELWRDSWLPARDPYIPPVMWDEEQFSGEKKLTIGYYTYDGWFEATPACQRAVLDAKALLEARGHTLVEFTPPRVTDVFRLFIGAVCVDGGRYLLDKIQNDIAEPTFAPLFRIYSLPLWLQRTLSLVIRHIYPRMANAMHAMPTNTSELREIYAAIEEYRHEFVLAMQAKGCDALICPANAMPAPPHDVPIRLFAACSYTAIFNLLDFGAGVVRISHVSEEDEAALSAYPETDPWYKVAKNATKGCVGLPVGVQVVGAPYREETVLRVMQAIENDRQ